MNSIKEFGITFAPSGNQGGGMLSRDGEHLYEAEDRYAVQRYAACFSPDRSDTFKDLIDTLGAHNFEMMATLVEYDVGTEHDGGYVSNVDIAMAVYWFCSENYKGQNCPLYAIYCASDYTPGLCESGPEEGSEAASIKEELEGIEQA
ncbi:MAG: hypothetical protein JKY94_17330 [Rhodobacteraceae bacterium]|nr:hypothetical protein [Paracoccaceae bacterium]